MINTIIFDLGGVLIDWNPRYLYRKIFDKEEEIDYFLENICTAQWNEEQDAGRSLLEGTNFLIEKYPEHKENITHYYQRWEEMLNGEIAGTVQILKQLKATQKYKLYALTNWSGETFSIAQDKFACLGWFDGILVSGVEKDLKPNLSFYQLLLKKFSIDPEKALFIDDREVNTAAAGKVGLSTIHFTTPAKLKEELEEKGVAL